MEKNSTNESVDNIFLKIQWNRMENTNDDFNKEFRRQLTDNVLICKGSRYVSWHVVLNLSVYFNSGTFVKNSKDSTHSQTKRNNEKAKEAGY